MKKRNGFTLIELLAVLIILAIIAIIVFPMIGDVITDSKMKAFRSSVDGLAHAVSLDYQKDYYKGVREYRYENGNLTLLSVKGETKNTNVKVEGMIENGVGTLSIDKDGNTSLIVYNDEWCAVKDFADKTISVEEKTDENCLLVTPNICFETEDVTIVETFDINLENCKNYMSEFQGSYWYTDENDQNAYCTKGQVASDGDSLEKSILYEYEDMEQLLAEHVIENVITKEGIEIVNYFGDTYDDISNEQVSQAIDERCTKDVVIPSKINEKNVIRIGPTAFMLKYLTSVKIPDSVSSIGHTAFGGNKLKNIKIPNGISAIPEHTFGGNQLSEVIIPDGVKFIGMGAFYLNQLKKISVPDSTLVIDIGSFQENQLTSVTIPNSVTTIGDHAFFDNQLTSVTIPDSVTTIENGAFSSNQLTSVTIPDSVTTIGYDAFRKNSSSNPNLTTIVNTTGRSFDWKSITGGSSSATFVTGTVPHNNGNITVSSS